MITRISSVIRPEGLGDLSITRIPADYACSDGALKSTVTASRSPRSARIAVVLGRLRLSRYLPSGLGIWDRGSLIEGLVPVMGRGLRPPGRAVAIGWRSC